MLLAQDSISIPVAYIETFVMTFVAFCIGYVGAVLYAKSKAKRIEKLHQNEINNLNKRIKTLQAESSAILDNTSKNDPTEQDLEQVKFQRRAFSDKVLEEKSIAKPSQSLEINFDRIGKATASQRNELQQITGIGPYTEAKLNELGIYTFEQISRLTDEDITTVTRLIKFFPDRIKNDRWVAKAKNLITTEAPEEHKSVSLKKI